MKKRRRYSLLPIGLWVLVFGLACSLLSAQENIPELVKKCKPAIVLITTYDIEGSASAQGTGFFINANGTLVTNRHVMLGAHSATVQTYSGENLPILGILAEDTQNDLIQVQVATPQEAMKDILSYWFCMDTTRDLNWVPNVYDLIPLCNLTSLSEWEMADDTTRDRYLHNWVNGESKTLLANIDEQSTLRLIMYSEASSRFIKKQTQSKSISFDKYLNSIGLKKGSNFTFLTLSTTLPQVGEKILVIGNPLGLEATVSDGLVSAVRTIPGEGDFIQITAPISPGSSGSPILNSKGEVIGIATFIITEGQNLNFAIPVKRIPSSYKKLIKLADWAEGNTKEWLISAEGLYFQGNLKVSDEKYEEAIPCFQQAIKINPKYEEAFLQLGYCYANLNQYDKAMENFKNANYLNREDPIIHYDIGNLYSNSEQYTGAIKEYKEAIRLNPDFAYAHSGLGNVYETIGNYTEAIEEYKQSIRLKPDFVVTHNNLGNTYNDLGRYSEAIEEYKEAINLKPDYADAYYNLGHTYQDLGKYPEAIEEYKEAINLKPDYAEAHLNLGNTYSNLKQYLQAKKEYKEVIRLSPDDPKAHNNLGNTYSDLEQYSNAIEEYKITIHIKPDFPMVHFNLGNTYNDLGRYSEAIEEYKEAINLKPDYAEAHFSLGNTYSNLTQYSEAIEEFKKAIELKPDFAKAHYNLGLYYLVIGNRSGALDEYKILKDLDKKWANNLFNLIYP